MASCKQDPSNHRCRAGYLPQPHGDKRTKEKSYADRANLERERVDARGAIGERMRRGSEQRKQDCLTIGVLGSKFCCPTLL
eukprot:768452-Hanusia_phi.AAC.3